MPTRRALLAAPLALPLVARAQAAWPERPIRWVVNFPPGGAADILSRAMAEQLGGSLGQPIVVENRPGAGGMVGSDIIAKARGDAHIVIMSNAASHGIGPVLYRNVPYDPLADFTHIGMVGNFPSVLCVGEAVPARSVAEFVALARQRGGLAYGSGGNGTMNHLTGVLFASAAGITLTHVPYRGSAAAMTDVIGGQIPAVMESLPSAMGHIRGGRLRALASSEPAADPALPGVPSFTEAGFPAVQSTNWFGFSTTAGIPDSVIQRWQGVIAEALSAPALRERFAGIGVRPGTLGRADYTAFIKAELDRWRAVIQAGGIQPD
jgi:tripartite-type tricarboxylate transporter receptor subunit TctC